MRNRKLYIANFIFEVISITVEGEPMFFAHCVAGAPPSLCAESRSMRVLGKMLKDISAVHIEYMKAHNQISKAVAEGSWEVVKNKPKSKFSIVATTIKSLSKCPRSILVSGFVYAN